MEKSFEAPKRNNFFIFHKYSFIDVGKVHYGVEYLKMLENVEKSNLIYKLEVFLNSLILQDYKDSIIWLQSSKDYLPWCEDLNVSYTLSSP